MGTYLQDTKGNDSIMRVMFVYLILYGTFMSTLVYFHAYNVMDAMVIFGTVTTLAVTLKLGQKGIDKEA